MSYTILTGVWEEVSDEIHRGLMKHGPRSMRLRETWDAIPPLGEEFGEVCQAVTQHRDEGRPIADARKELVQLAACAVAMIQHIDDANIVTLRAAPLKGEAHE